MTSARLVTLAGQGLAALTWLSASLFGLYILVFYALALVTGDLVRWNRVLPLYDPGMPGAEAAHAGIGLHFLGGGLILVLGSVQFVPWIRERAPAVHRWTGRLYVLACLAAAVGGLVFIALHGTIGGLVMDVGFAIYGGLMLAAAVFTARHAMARRLGPHRAWAVRLYALAIGSWLYRMGYGFWLLLADGAGHTDAFDGWFDVVMDFAFFVPNLLVAELWLRAGGASWGESANVAVGSLFVVAMAVVALGTWFFTTELWGPAMISVLAG